MAALLIRARSFPAPHLLVLSLAVGGSRMLDARAARAEERAPAPGVDARGNEGQAVAPQEARPASEGKETERQGPADEGRAAKQDAQAAPDKAATRPEAQPAEDKAAPTAEPEDADSEDADEQGPEEGEEEARGTASSLDDSPRYTAELSDAELLRRFVGDLPALGSVSVGFADEGRVINAVQLPPGDAWQLVTPEYAWGTQETIDGIMAVARAVRAQYPLVNGVRVNHIGKKDGGYLRPHRSHQSGRDVDFGFFYKDNANPGDIRGSRATQMDLGPNWALIRALATETDVQMVLVDKRIIAVLHAYGLAQGEDPTWLDSIFKGPTALVQHARRHRDHYHVRFFCPRSQELGRRVQPLLAKRPDENIAIYRVRSGDTLGHIAMHYGSTVSMIQKANGMRSSFLSIGRTLSIPLRGPCTRCPLPPPLVVPPRKLPPVVAAATTVNERPSNPAVVTPSVPAVEAVQTPSDNTAQAVPPS